MDKETSISNKQEQASEVIAIRMRDYKAYIFCMLCRVAVAIYYLIYNNYVK